MGFLLRRFTEPSSWGGLGAITLGLGELFKVSEAAPLVEAIGQGAAAVVQTGNPVTGLIATGLGVLSFLLKERTK